MYRPPKKAMYVIVLLMFSVALIWVCTSQSDTRRKMHGNRENDLQKSDITSISKNHPVKDSFNHVLLLGSTFTEIAADSSKKVTLSNLYKESTDDEMAYDKRKFAVSDLDCDGIPEIILLLGVRNNEIPYGYEILHYQDEEIVGYPIAYRRFSCLKADGSFISSGGAYDWGIFSIVAFEETGIKTSAKMECTSSENSHGELTVDYFIDGDLVSQSEFEEGVRVWNLMEDSPFFALTCYDDGIFE